MALIVVLSQSQTAVVATRVAASNMTAVMAVEQKEIEAALKAGIRGHASETMSTSMAHNDAH